MRFNVLTYFFSEGFKNVFKNKKSTFSCLGVMCGAMLIFGLFYAIGRNINSMVENLEAKQSFNVFIEHGTTEEQIQKMGEEINKIEGVNKISFTSQEEAYNSMREMLGDASSAMDGFEPTAFRASYSVTLTDLSANDYVQQEILKLDNVNKIVSNNETIKKLNTIAKWIRITTIAILVVLISISIFIIANTIKLTVHARRKEISIMKYVGATNRFIRTPFIIEGIIIGLIAGLISIVLVGGGYNYLANKLIQNQTVQDIGINVIPFAQMSTNVIIVYLVLGIGIGIIGSSISMRKYLEV